MSALEARACHLQASVAGAPMNLAAGLALASAAISLSSAAIAWRLGRAPGWSELRWFSVIALAASLYAIGNIATTTGQPDALVVLASRFQTFGTLLEVWAFYRLSDHILSRAPGRLERLARASLFACALAALVPGAVFSGEVRGHEFAPWGVSYRDAAPTAFGEVAFVFGCLGSLLLVVLLVRGWRRGVRGAGALTAALGTMLLLAVNDAAAASGLAELPYLLDVGFLVPLAVVFWSQAERFVAEAQALRHLREKLEGLVSDRTAQLARAQDALHQAEKLAALGQFAAGVAHQVNNPAAVVTASLSYLAEPATLAAASPEAREAVGEAREAMGRITSLVRQLVDAGRVAGRGGPGATGCALAPAARRAVEDVLAAVDRGVRCDIHVPPDLAVRARPEALHQVLTALLANAAQAAPPGRPSRVGVSARAGADGRVLLEVADDGVGMPPEVLRRAFEPFFTTRPEGQGSGLGLPVARALVEGMGGTVALESEPGGGTRARLDLPSASQDRG